jgi:hypothetical protein
MDTGDRVNLRPMTKPPRASGLSANEFPVVGAVAALLAGVVPRRIPSPTGLAAMWKPLVPFSGYTSRSV